MSTILKFPTNGAEALHVQSDGTTRWKTTAQHRTRVIPACFDLQLVEPGDYQAIYEGHRGITVFRQKKLLVAWRLLAHPGILLPRYYPVKYYQPRISASGSSNLVREVAAVLGRKFRSDQVPVGLMAGIPAIVEVRTVTHDRHQHQLDAINQYSTISRVKGPS